MSELHAELWIERLLGRKTLQHALLFDRTSPALHAVSLWGGAEQSVLSG